MRTEDLDRLLAPLPSGRHGLPREHVVRSQRMRLLHAAIAVAGTDGYAAMTVSATIAHANVSRKTFYEQFADREDCFLAAYGLLLDRGLARIRAAYARERDAVAGVRRSLAWTLEALARHPQETRVVFVEALAAGPRAWAVRDRALRELASLLAAGFAATPAWAAVPASMPQAVVGALCELIGARVRDGGAGDLPGLLPDLLFCALAPFLGPDAAGDALMRVRGVRASLLQARA